LLEREQDLNLLTDLLADIDSSGGSVVLVRGEAGIGKSSLVREFISAHGEDSHVLIGWCDDLSTPQPFGPFWDIARTEPSLTGPLEDADRRALMEAVMDLLSRTLRPTILVVEDTQWADEAKLDADDIVAITDGNPFLVTQIALAGDDVVPSSVQDSVMTRMRKLSPEAQELLRLLSVIPERIPRLEISQLTDRTDSALEEAERRGLLDDEDGYVAFRHDLIRRAVESTMTTAENVVSPCGRGRANHRRGAGAEIGCPYERAIALSDGDHPSQLEALEQLEALGATAVADKLRQELRDQGVAVPRRRARTTNNHGTTLTARQAEILFLLAEKRSNAEIADHLCLSPRTVEHHVAAVMSKLDASSRDEAVTTAQEQGMLEPSTPST